MQTRTRNPFTTIHTEGALLPSDLLQRILENDSSLPGLSPEGYHLSGEKLNEAINRSWNRLQGAWAAFRASRSRLNAGDAGTTLTRERWLLPLFQELGYGRLLTAKAMEIEGKSYPISHGWANVPIHLVGCGVDLERRSAGVAGASKASPHSLMQEFLNRSPEAQWGLVSNGLRLRVLRDNASLTRQAFLEFDLEAMFEGEVYSDFALLWLICHQSRFEVESKVSRLSDVQGQKLQSQETLESSIIEQWSKAAQEQGARALEQLRKGVEQAIAALGQGFLRAPANQKLRADLRSGALSTQDYYRQLLRLVYRLIFLFVAEDRDLLFDPSADAKAKERYLRHYALGRLRRLAERSRGGRHPDLYAALRLVTDILGGRKALTPDPSPGGRGENVAVAGLGLSVLGGFLFAGEALPDLESAELENESLLSAIRHLTLMDAYGRGGNRRAVDYKNLGARELGSVYESLLELHPLINADAATFELNAVAGSERKTTGSFYTPEELIAVLLDSALEPVIERALDDSIVDNSIVDNSIVDNSIVDSRKSSTRMPNIEYSNNESRISLLASRLLNLKICDPACGSGHFLLAAARRLARRLAQLRAGESEPPPEVQRAALREVISQCIYGVDLNPMSVELCKVSLWMEALEPGKPLSFLDARIQCGDSLVGVAPGLDISEIPDEAFNAAFGDDKATASALKKRNKAERGGQMGLDAFVIRDQEDLAAWMARQAQEMDALPEETAEQVGQKAQSYREYLDSPQYRRRKQEYDLWTAAFFWKMEAQPGSAGILAPTQEMLRRQRAGGANALPPELLRRVEELARRLKFLHWELAFPKVFAGENPGFDCVLGNPPWEKINLKDEEYFAQSHPEIANAKTKAIREKLIEELKIAYPSEYDEFTLEQAYHDNLSNYCRFGGSYPFTGVSRINLYSLFAELGLKLLAPKAKIGLVIASGIATDDNNKALFENLVAKNRLISIFDFENREGIFPAIDSRYKFCLFCAGGKDIGQAEADFAFYLTNVRQISIPEKHFTLSHKDLININPNTRTCPTFKSRQDAEIVKAIYSRISAWCFHEAVEEIGTLKTPFNMSNDSWMFQTTSQLKALGGNIDSQGFIVVNNTTYLPLYESKFIHQFNHRFAAFDSNDMSDSNAIELSETELGNPYRFVDSRYWLDKKVLEERFPGKWFLAYRMITNATNERGSIATIIPERPCGNSITILTGISALNSALLCATMNSFVFDFVARLKIPGMNFNHWILKQLPILPPSAYTPADIAYIAPRVLELVYTAYDLRPFAEDMWNADDGQWTTNDGKTLRDLFVAQWETNRRDPESQSALKHFPPPEAARFPEVPFVWNESRRAQLRAELDAYYARLYGLTRDELRYILDPKEVHGQDFPGETFRVLKEKEIKLYGEYRTRRLVLEAWDNLEGLKVEGWKVESKNSAEPTADDGRRTAEVAPTVVKAEEPENRSAELRITNNELRITNNKLPNQPMLSDFGLYKCVQCGKMVMGYEKEGHVKEKHGGKAVEWTKVR